MSRSYYWIDFFKSVCLYCSWVCFARARARVCMCVRMESKEKPKCDVEGVHSAACCQRIARVCLCVCCQHFVRDGARLLFLKRNHRCFLLIGESSRCEGTFGVLTENVFGCVCVYLTLYLKGAQSEIIRHRKTINVLLLELCTWWDTLRRVSKYCILQRRQFRDMQSEPLLKRPVIYTSVYMVKVRRGLGVGHYLSSRTMKHRRHTPVFTLCYSVYIHYCLFCAETSDESIQDWPTLLWINNSTEPSECIHLLWVCSPRLEKTSRLFILHLSRSALNHSTLWEMHMSLITWGPF